MQLYRSAKFRVKAIETINGVRITAETGTVSLPRRSDTGQIHALTVTGNDTWDLRALPHATGVDRDYEGKKLKSITVQSDDGTGTIDLSFSINAGAALIAAYAEADGLVFQPCDSPAISDALASECTVTASGTWLVILEFDV